MEAVSLPFKPPEYLFYIIGYITNQDLLHRAETSTEHFVIICMRKDLKESEYMCMDN